MPDTILILHVKGTEAETAQLPKHVVRTAISQGQLTHSQLIWNAAANTWKQVRELPDLLPSQRLAPAPARAVAIPVPKVVDAIIPESPASPVARAVAVSASIPKVRVAAASASIPQVRVAAVSASIPKVRVAAVSTETPTIRAATPVPVHSTGNLAVKKDEASHPLKGVCIGLGILILLVFGGNYLLVDQPLVSNLSQTSYSNVGVFGHFGAFVQPNAMVIHIPASSKITPDNLTDFLVALARSTPQDPITRDLFERIALTSGWTAQYSFSGYTWKQLGGMGQEGEAQRKEFLLAQMNDASGQSLMPESTLSEAAQQAAREQVWETFVAQFTAKR
jgi:hypothetical protein